MTSKRKYFLSRWDDYDSVYWSTQEEMMTFFGINKRELVMLIRATKPKIEDKVVIRANTCLHLYNRQQLLAAIHDHIFNHKTRKGSRAKKLKIVKSIDNQKFISYEDACRVYDCSRDTIAYRITRWHKEVESVLYVQCETDGLLPKVKTCRYFNREELEDAMNYFLQRKYSVSGYITAIKEDRHIVDVQSASFSKRNKATLEHLGLDPREFYD